MNVSKDILRLLIEEYFHLETIYQCQFVSKFSNECITHEMRYKARLEKLAINMRKKQNEYFIKKKKETINFIVNEKMKNRKGRTRTTRKLLKQKYIKQEGNPYCNFCSFVASPNEISLHIGKHANYYYEEEICKTCGCVNPIEKESPHFKEGCPLI